MENHECINNNIDNYAFYLFLFLVTLSMGSDFYYVLQNIQNTDFIKKQISKYEDYSNLFSNVLCNNIGTTIKKIKSKKIKNNTNEDNKEYENMIKDEKIQKNKEILEEVNKIKDDSNKNIKKKVRKINKPIEKNDTNNQEKKKLKYNNQILEEA